jgi:outer membrane protein OmpA-like peptidoglycan-associated protein
VKADRIATTGFGETRPKSSDQASRRVEIVVVLR